MNLLELSTQYDCSAQLLRRRIGELCLAARQTDDPAAQQALLHRIADLQPMLYQCRQLRDLTAHYYERSFHRNENYTL